MQVYDLPTPALLIDRGKLKRNLENMANVAKIHQVKLRPHTKTHKSPYIAHLQQAYGAVGVTVATQDEAEVMAYNGIPDVFAAYPVVERQRAMRLARLGRLAKVRVGVDSEVGARHLSKAALEYKVSLGVLIEIDTGLKEAVLPKLRKSSPWQRPLTSCRVLN